MLRKEYLFVIMNLSGLMVEKCEEPISHVYGCINFWITIAVVRLYYCIICQSRLPGPLWDREKVWDPVSGLGLAQ